MPKRIHEVIGMYNNPNVQMTLEAQKAMIEREERDLKESQEIEQDKPTEEKER